MSESRRPTSGLPQAFPLERGELAYLTDADEPTRHRLSHAKWSPSSTSSAMTAADLATLRVLLVLALTRVEDEMDARNLLGRVTPRTVTA